MLTLKRIWKSLVAFSSAWGLLPSTIATYVTATAWVCVMALLGRLESVPLFWIMMGLPLAGASIFTLALRASEWRARMSAASKLLFQGVNLGGDYNKNKKGQITSMKGAQVRVVLQSVAQFPISFIVDEMHTSFDGKYPPDKPRNDNGAVTSAHELRMYNDNPIELNNEAIKDRVIGTAKIKLRYGHPGREKYVISKSITFEVQYQPNIGHVIIAQQETI